MKDQVDENQTAAVPRSGFAKNPSSDAALSGQEQWYVHIVGPDDVIEKTGELDALRSANAVNIEIERARRSHANDPNWPYLVALAVKNIYD